VGEFRVKKIMLPSGKEVEVVYFSSNPKPADLSICEKCDSDLVYPVAWSEQADDMWLIDRRCPNCEWRDESLHKHAIVEEYDLALNRGTDEVIDGLEILSKANMEHDVDAFKAALDADQIFPEDF